MVVSFARGLCFLVMMLLFSSCVSNNEEKERQAGSNTDPCAKIDIQKDQDGRHRCYQEQIAILHKELERRLALYYAETRERARTKIVSSTEADPLYKQYMQAWIRKVERFANQNYPDELRRNHLYGNVILAVQIKADGSLGEVEVRKSSGQSALDMAAVEAVKGAAPFEVFSDEMREKCDVLIIIRTFRFVHGIQK
jgi:protein TonB